MCVYIYRLYRIGLQCIKYILFFNWHDAENKKNCMWKIRDWIKSYLYVWSLSALSLEIFSTSKKWWVNYLVFYYSLALPPLNFLGAEICTIKNSSPEPFAVTVLVSRTKVTYKSLATWSQCIFFGPHHVLKNKNKKPLSCHLKNQGLSHVGKKRYISGLSPKVRRVGKTRATFSYSTL